MEAAEVKISVLMAVYNGAGYLREAIESILSQTFTDFEFLIVNDGSEDDSREIIFQYPDKRIRYIENEANRGLVYCLNRGLSVARGKYIARMDCDDKALPGRFKLQFDYLESHPEIGLCGSYVEAYFEDTGRKQILRFPESDADIRAFAYFQAPFCHPSVMIRKAVLDLHGLQYPDGFYRAEDYALWVKLLQFTPGANLPFVLLIYRKHEASETALEDKRMDEKNRVIGRILKGYFEQDGIVFPEETVSIFTWFVNRSLPFDMSRTNQQQIKPVLVDFLDQLSEKRIAKKEKVLDFLSEICFYRVFTCRQLPSNLYLLNLTFRGAFRYLVKFIFRN